MYSFISPFHFLISFPPFISKQKNPFLMNSSDYISRVTLSSWVES